MCTLIDGFLFCFCSYLLYITQLINNQEMKPHQYSVYIKSVTMHPVPAFNKARYGRFEFSLGIFRYFPRFEFSPRNLPVHRTFWVSPKNLPVHPTFWVSPRNLPVHPTFWVSPRNLSVHPTFSWEYTSTSFDFPWEVNNNNNNNNNLPII